MDEALKAVVMCTNMQNVYVDADSVLMCKKKKKNQISRAGT